jgi:hypothetical protein
VVIGGGYIKFAGFAVVHQKIIGLLSCATKPRPKTRRGCLAETGLTGLGSLGAGSFEVEDTRRDRKPCVEAKKGAIAGHPSDGENLKNSKTSHEGLVSLVIKYWYFRLSVVSYITQEVRGWQQSLGTLVHLPSYFPFLFLRISIGLA